MTTLFFCLVFSALACGYAVALRSIAAVFVGWIAFVAAAVIADSIARFPVCPPVL
jgi:hypothetical protein